jgi:hypothetical protein
MEADRKLAEIDRAAHEYAAWQAIVLELKRAGLDINQEEALHAAIKLWGEQLAYLRELQDAELRANALDEAMGLFNRHIGFVPRPR